MKTSEGAALKREDEQIYKKRYSTSYVFVYPLDKSIASLNHPKTINKKNSSSNANGNVKSDSNAQRKKTNKEKSAKTDGVTLRYIAAKNDTIYDKKFSRF